MLVDRIFQYSFHDKNINTVHDAKVTINRVLTHYIPDTADHDDCYYARYKWCKTAYGKAKNKSSSLKSALPIGMRNLFKSWLYDNILTDTLIRVLLKPGCTSLNESCNKIINKYAHKKRHLGGESYTHAVARGVMQWNDPYMHLVDGLQFYGIYLTSNQMDWINRQIKHTNYVSAKNSSHEAQLKRHQQKYSLDCSAYVGGGIGIFDYIEQFDLMDDIDEDE